MRIILRLISDQFCMTCSAKGFVDEKHRMCLSCNNIRLTTNSRKTKLDQTLQVKWAYHLPFRLNLPPFQPPPPTNRLRILLKSLQSKLFELAQIGKERK